MGQVFALQAKHSRFIPGQCHTEEVIIIHRSEKFQTLPNAKICLDLVKACEGVFLLCFLGQIVTWQYNPYLLD